MTERLRIIAAVIRGPGLARIELGYFGFSMTQYATWVAVLVYAYRLGGAGSAGFAALIQLIPAGLVAPFAAYASDRFRRDHVLLLGYLVQAASLGLTALAMDLSLPLPLTLVASTVAAASFTFTRPAQGAILPVITHSPADLTAANAVSGLAENLGVFAGPLVGGLLLRRGEPGDVFAAFGAVTLMAALLVFRLPIDVAAVRPEVRLAAGDVVREALDGFAVLRRQRALLLLVLVISSTVVVTGALDILFVAVAVDLLHVGASWAGFFYAASGVGGIAGALGAVALVGRRRLTPSMAGAGVLFGLPIALIGLVPGQVLALALFAGSGAGYSLASVAGQTLLQRIAPDASLARVFGILESLRQFSVAIGSVAGAILVAALGARPALALVGLFVPATLAMSWIWLRALDRNAPVPDPEGLAALRRLPIFAPLSAPSIERIMANLGRLEVPAGYVLICEGDEGDRFYVLVEGSVAISQGGRQIAVRSAPDQLGEIALLRGVPRTATVTAATPVKLLTLDRAPFLAAISGHPGSHMRAKADAEARLLADDSAPGIDPA